MCLAIPARIVAINGDSGNATVALGEVHKEISLALLEGVAVGDYVLVHVGYAISRLDKAEAQRTLQLFAEAGVIGGLA